MKQGLHPKLALSFRLLIRGSWKGIHIEEVEKFSGTLTAIESLVGIACRQWAQLTAVDVCSSAPDFYPLS